MEGFSSPSLGNAIGLIFRIEELKIEHGKWKMQRMERVRILGIPIDAVMMNEAVLRVGNMLKSAGQHHVMTPNSEMLVEGQRNPAFRAVMQSATLNLPDSVGILRAARWVGQEIAERVSGVDFVEQLCGKLDQNVPVFFLGGRGGVGERARDKLGMKNAELRIVGTYEGSPRDADAEDIIQRVNSSGAHLLLVAYGAPQQDLWIAKHFSKMPCVRVAIGVGGTFDFLSGRITRAPKWMQHMGLEWLWRLCKEPQRWKRMIHATIVFPFLVITKTERH